MSEVRCIAAAEAEIDKQIRGKGCDREGGHREDDRCEGGHRCNHARRPGRRLAHDLLDGQQTTVAGSGSSTYVLHNGGGMYSCTCPAWRNPVARGEVLDRKVDQNDEKLGVLQEQMNAAADLSLAKVDMAQQEASALDDAAARQRDAYEESQRVEAEQRATIEAQLQSRKEAVRPVRPRKYSPISSPVPGAVRVSQRAIRITLDPTATNGERQALTHFVEQFDATRLVLPGDPHQRQLRFRIAE